MTYFEYYVFGVGCMRLTRISYVLNEVGIPIIPRMFSYAQLHITSLKTRIYRGTAVAHIATKYYVAAGMARDGEIDTSYLLTALQSYWRGHVLEAVHSYGNGRKDTQESPPE